MTRCLLAIFLILGCVPSGFAAEFEEVSTLKRHFDEAGVVGTFVLFDAKADRVQGFDKARANKRFIPASTFKFPNTLIGLETGAVKSVDEIFPYNGEKRAFPTWEKSMGLREGFKVSNVPVYQEVARRIGPKAMAEWVKKIDYGNCDIGTVIDQFWLEGPLAISAVEQTRFLDRLASGTLPFKPEVIAAMKEISLVEETPEYRLYAKTGWSRKIGWWVGWIEKGGHIRTFALNIEMTELANAPKRLEVTRACLKELGAL